MEAWKLPEKIYKCGSIGKDRIIEISGKIAVKRG